MRSEQAIAVTSLASSSPWRLDGKIRLFLSCIIGRLVVESPRPQGRIFAWEGEKTVRLTKGADYGARGVVYLARQGADSVVLVSEVASAEGLPESYLAKVVQALAKEGIVRSHRGAKGGFSLARDPAEITFREVIEAIEGPIALCHCLLPQGNCDKMESCALYPVLLDAQQRFLSMLDSTTLYDLANGTSQPVP